VSDKAFALIRFAEWLDRSQREAQHVHKDLWRVGLRDTAGHLTSLTDKLARYERLLLQALAAPRDPA
jgi:hypothetical protein